MISPPVAGIIDVEFNTALVISYEVFLTIFDSIREEVASSAVKTLPSLIATLLKERFIFDVELNSSLNIKVPAKTVCGKTTEKITISVTKRDTFFIYTIIHYFSTLVNKKCLGNL